MKEYILAFDQGTTSSRAIVFNRQGQIVSLAQKEFKQIYPQPGWVEHDPSEIWSTQVGVAAEAISKAGLQATDIAAIGITNQRETTVVWDRQTGKVLYNAIVWQDRRTAEFCDDLKLRGYEELIRQKTGLVIDAYFSATKIYWILANVPGAREKADAGQLAFGTIDSWLIWNMTGRQVHVTDVTNASRTLLYNIHTLSWDEELLDLFQIPASMLPEVRSSSEVVGETSAAMFATRIPIAGIAGDQQAALFGQMCTQPGMVKNTYGTGCFMLMNIGDKPIISTHKLVTTIAWKINGQVNYALEGSIFIAGAVVQWLRDGLGLISTSAEVEDLAGAVTNSEGVYMVPAFAGLGAPHWNQHARGTIVGMTRGTTSAHLARAALESIAFQTREVLKAMEADASVKIAELRVDGGATVNNLLMQFQANILGAQVVRPEITEVTASGAAYLAGLAVGFWSGINDIQQQWQVERRFEPEPGFYSDEMVKGWKRAVKAAKAWAEDDDHEDHF
ncbi:glycerol kinase GlpK [Adhaeribacter radiodurans]|uniref:Glycerol kinase n=1 Tax=Adhaeribacter radiodurans TaxID=2745197 RepID=A0A7L7L1U2_9BACT|nr:glycerol kinase GlpK [Adhaeribacter radiodurans]QMU26761.1 glycerol kinase GlpK [Adhaeribacter radiodurans]